MLYAFMLFADAAKDAAGGPDGGAPVGGLPGILSNPLWMFLIIGVLFYFMMLRPAQKQERERKAMIAALKKNDKVIACGGIIGTVATVKDNEEEVTLRLEDNVRIRVLRSSIARVVSRSEEPEKDQSKTEGS